MNKIFMLLCFLPGGILMAQELSVTGRVFDVDKNPLSFVNILAYEGEAELPSVGTTTESDGSFVLNKLKSGTYRLRFTYVGYEDYEQVVEVNGDRELSPVILKEQTHILDETLVRAKLPTIQKTSGKLTFNVENTALSVGSTMDLLKKTPGVVVIGDKIQIKFSSPTIFINGKRVYLSTAEVISLLENTDAANIKSIEVITNPSAKYDADSGTALNIITSKAISIGYKGSVNGTFEQAIYPKYLIGTSHFYKNNWLNLYASYSYGKRKEYKEDVNYIRFFQPDERSTKSIWETDFNRTTRATNHTGNLVLDFALDEKNTISFISNISVSPNVKYQNNGKTDIRGPLHQLDSTSTTRSDVEYKKDNLIFGMDYNSKLDDKGTSLSVSANYIYYDHLQEQHVSSDYFLSNNDFLRNNSFLTESSQRSNIFTAQTDFTANLWDGDFKSGLKFSDIDTKSKLDFFDVESSTDIFNSTLSDNFNYIEDIYAAYFTYEKNWQKWTVELGVRGEYTDINAISHSLGNVNTNQYFDIFPSTSVDYSINDNNRIGVGYNRSIHRPRYESLNPFKYFITENNFIGGNPNLRAAIEDRFTISFSHKNKLFFELYYQTVKNGLDNLSFQNNEGSTLRNVMENMDEVYQYSFDAKYLNSLTSWWYFYLSTSTYYLSNRFYALESREETATNDTFGQYLGMYNHFTLIKEQSLTAELGGIYISDFAFGNRYFKNQSYINVSIRKEFWDKRASLTLGVDDVFDTLNKISSVSRYYNQDNRFSVKKESRVFRVGFKYNFGNARLRDNQKEIKTDEGERLGK